MPIITPPKIVQDALDEFLAPLLQNNAQRKHLANYTTGLMISPNKTVAGMTHEMPNASDQSCLNRFLTEVNWDENAMSKAQSIGYSNLMTPNFTNVVSLPSMMCYSTRAERGETAEEGDCLQNKNLLPSAVCRLPSFMCVS
jgi:hypothetical protein